MSSIGASLGTACLGSDYTTSATRGPRLALQAGVDVKIVSERLGHASATITWDIYQHVTPAMQSDAAERVANLIFRPRASS